VCVCVCMYIRFMCDGEVAARLHGLSCSLTDACIVQQVRVCVRIRICVCLCVCMYVCMYVCIMYVCV
jgi:hypothetical protein